MRLLRDKNGQSKRIWRTSQLISSVCRLQKGAELRDNRKKWNGKRLQWPKRRREYDINLYLGRFRSKNQEWFGKMPVMLYYYLAEYKKNYLNNWRNDYAQCLELNKIIFLIDVVLTQIYTVIKYTSYYIVLTYTYRAYSCLRTTKNS